VMEYWPGEARHSNPPQQHPATETPMTSPSQSKDRSSRWAGLNRRRFLRGLLYDGCDCPSLVHWSRPLGWGATPWEGSQRLPARCRSAPAPAGFISTSASSAGRKLPWLSCSHRFLKPGASPLPASGGRRAAAIPIAFSGRNPAWQLFVAPLDAALLVAARQVPPHSII
jgi:hypothetical protein